MDYDYDAESVRQSDAQIDGYEQRMRECDTGSCPGCSWCRPKKEQCPRCGERMRRRGGSYGYPGSLTCKSALPFSERCRNARREESDAE